jgi:K+-sensing histidine kinase KdpD
MRIALDDVRFLGKPTADFALTYNTAVTSRCDGATDRGRINDVLDLSKIEAGQLILELSDYSVQDIAHTVRSTLEPLAADKKLAFKVEMAAELPPGHGDGRRLTQVLINLVGNAIKFTDAGEPRVTPSTFPSSCQVDRRLSAVPHLVPAN